MTYGKLFVLFFIFTIGFFSPMNVGGEAKVLPSGTTITYPDGRVETLSSTGFLLTRRDMETATFFMETYPLLKSDYETLTRGYRSQEDALFFWRGASALEALGIIGLSIAVVAR